MAINRKQTIDQTKRSRRGRMGEKNEKFIKYYARHCVPNKFTHFVFKNIYQQQRTNTKTKLNQFFLQKTKNNH